MECEDQSHGDPRPRGHRRAPLRGEPVCCVRAHYVGDGAQLLDVGSGAGFPGVPTALLLPQVRVTLAESQGKKAAFLREVVRVLELETEVWGGRTEDLPKGLKFDGVMLRAVDHMTEMEGVGRDRVKPGGVLLRLTTQARHGGRTFPVPGMTGGVVEVEEVVNSRRER